MVISYMQKTVQEYEMAMAKSKDIFIKKMKDYGSAAYFKIKFIN